MDFAYRSRPRVSSRRMVRNLEKQQPPRMSETGKCEYTRLRVLVEATRRLDSEATKDILISLHKVLNEIQLLKQQALNGSEAESESDDEKISYCQCEEDCVKRIVGDMVYMLRTDSEFVQHSAVNVLVTLSKLVAESEKDFEPFISSLSRCLEMGTSNGLSWFSTSSNIESHGLGSVQSSEWEKNNLGTVNWFVVSSIIQIYRQILKNLKQDYEEKVLQLYLKYIFSWLASFPWRSAGNMHVDQSTVNGHPEIYSNRLLGPKLKMLLSGNLLQLFCSLADRGYYSDSATSLDLRHQVLQKIQNLIPLLSSWCLNSQEDVISSSIHHYFKHKLLMLMVRLADEISIDRSIYRLCLEHLHKYFEDDLNQKLTLSEVADIAALQDSPFSQSAYEEGVFIKASQPHLQRLAILLFFKCAVSMITLEAKRNLSCVCPNSLTSADLEIKCCDARKGVTELYIWLQGQHPIDSSVELDFDTYVEMCKTFASSLLQLFVNEDDMLFQVLLQVFNLPSCTTQMFHEDKFSLQKVKCDIVFHVSNIFNPVLLFHTFLSKYDHQILLDYLISKDVGLSCAEYLLKCLRKVSESWRSFMQYSCKKISIQLKKKRKIFPMVSEKDGDETCMPGERGQVFEQTKQCLLSLRVSVENLHQRRLFPYNAKVLLKRLQRFEELCHIEENQNSRESRI